jgi:hypothetical protein
MTDASRRDAGAPSWSPVQRKSARALDEGPYRVVPGTTVRHVEGDLWLIEGAGTRRQNDFFPLKPLVVPAHELPAALTPPGAAADVGGVTVTSDSCSEELLAALVREQALVRAPGDVVAPEAELEALASSGRSGVLLIAMGKPSYGRLAAALAATIKSGSPSLPLALAWSGDVRAGLGHARELFDHLIPIDAVLSGRPEHREPFFVKLCVDELTPFEETLFIDADSLIYPGVDLRKDLWRYAGRDFVPTTSFVWDLERVPAGAPYMCWGPLQTIVDLFGLKRPVIQAHSYYFYFSKTRRASDLFECGRQVHRMLSSDKHRFKAHLDDEGRVPDELAFGVATSMVGVEPYFERHQPMVESGLFYVDPPASLESCYLGFTVTGYNPNWSEHYAAVIARHGLSKYGYELEKDLPPWLRALQGAAAAV